MDTPSKKEQQWERELLEKIALASLQELKVKLGDKVAEGSVIALLEVIEDKKPTNKM